MPESNSEKYTAERKSERAFTATGCFKAPVRQVFEAWTNPERFQRWWIPKSFCVTLISCEMDIRTGGSYRLVMSHPSSPQPMAFFGRYTDVTPHTRMVWTNDEGGEDGPVTTVTFEERGDETLVTLCELYPTKAALDAAIASGSTSGFGEQFAQLATLLAA